MSLIKKITVTHSAGKYSILTGRGLLGRIGTLVKPVLRPGARVLVVSNEKVKKLYFLRKVLSSLQENGFKATVCLLLHGNEKDKSVKMLLKLWERMAEIPLERTSAVVAVGGGVVGDISGFAASTYMRGIPVIQVPTTLLAQVDSSIGGKTAINLAAAKNIVGTFHQPRMVIADVDALKSLSSYEFANQFSEVIKYGVIKDPVLFRILEKRLEQFFAAVKKGTVGDSEKAFLEEVVRRSSKVKAAVVSKDEKETKGLRMILNYGHTFAHGFESASGYRLPHGNAVALGMLCAGRLAVQMGLWPVAAEKRQAALIRTLPGLKSIAQLRLGVDSVLNGMARDKKKKDGCLRFVLPVEIGKVVVRDGISPALIREVIEEIRRKK